METASTSTTFPLHKRPDHSRARRTKRNDSLNKPKSKSRFRLNRKRLLLLPVKATDLHPRPRLIEYSIGSSICAKSSLSPTGQERLFRFSENSYFQPVNKFQGETCGVSTSSKVVSRNPAFKALPHKHQTKTDAATPPSKSSQL